MPARTPFPLKPKLKTDIYAPGVCSASRCTAAPVLSYSVPTGPWPDETVHLCQRHWLVLSAADGDQVRP